MVQNEDKRYLLFFYPFINYHNLLYFDFQ